MATATQKLVQIGTTANTLAPGARMVIDPDLRDAENVKLDVESATVVDGFLVLSLNTGAGTFDVQNIGSVAATCTFTAYAFYSSSLNPTEATTTPTAVASANPDITVGETFKTLVISEDGSNIVATDASGGATSFFLELAQSDVTGVTFDGVNGSCSIPNAGIEPASVTWWLEFTLLQNTTSERILIHAGSPGDVMSVYYFGATTDLINAQVRTSAGVSSLFTLGASIIGTKYQMAFTYDGSTIATLYLDGVLQDSDSTTGAIAYGGSNPFYLASFHGASQFNNMQFSNVAVFDYVLPASELLELKAETKTPTTTTTPALSWWPCTDTAGTTLTDTISARNGTLSGGFTFDASAEAFTLANPSGLTAGQTYRWLVETGGLRTCTYGGYFVSESGASLQISQGAGDKDMIVGTVSDDASEIYCTIQKDFS